MYYRRYSEEGMLQRIQTGFTEGLSHHRLLLLRTDRFKNHTPKYSLLYGQAMDAVA
jgi:hypothetical protein